MEFLLLGLLFLALAAGLWAAWRVYVRLRRIEREVRDLAALNLLHDRMQALADMVQQVDAPKLRRELERIYDSLHAVDVSLQRLADHTARPMPAPQPEYAQSRADSVRNRVRTTLRDEGYQSIRILAAEPDLEAEPAVLRVEAQRQGLRVLGTVTVERGQVVDLRLDPNYALFP